MSMALWLVLLAAMAALILAIALKAAAFIVFAGLAVILAVASLIAAWLARGQPAGARDPVIENLVQRIKAWWVMAAVLALAFALGRPAVIFLFAFASFAALREFVTLLPTRRGDHWALAALFFVVLPVQYALIFSGWYGLYSIFIPVYAFLLLPIFAALKGDTTRFMERIAAVQWAAMIAIFALSHVPALLTLDIAGYEGRNLLLIAFLVFVVQISDVLQYVWGKLLGRRKIAPRLSPSKTVEGFAGGVLSATLIGAGLWWITPFSPGDAALMAFIVTLMGFLGGLVMSAIKRDRGVKDWGQMIEGHGGMLDRLDSVIFAAPVFFHLTRYFWA